MMAEAPQVLMAEGLTSGYGELPIVEDVTIHVGQSEIVTIIGPNGAGKSTLLKALFGFLPIWKGQVSFAGDDVTGQAPELLACRGLAFVPQTDNVFPNLSIRENLVMGGITRVDGVEERIAWIFELFPVLAERPRERAGRGKHWRSRVP
jgi:branched-chain amino acid transport system ATP-binding protein